ncbi:hypothetical protein XH89_35870 [Bradyrhizobium sp. CCBAU 53340]|nr:hypothetical protein XH89_35870 [Bradyrhizobium sp. CCBAU 53340]
MGDHPEAIGRFVAGWIAGIEAVRPQLAAGEGRYLRVVCFARPAPVDGRASALCHVMSRCTLMTRSKARAARCRSRRRGGPLSTAGCGP